MIYEQWNWFVPKMRHYQRLQGYLITDYRITSITESVNIEMIGLIV